MRELDTEILIVGGGLSGLRLADLLVQDGRDVQLIEARGRLGGRILSHSAEEAHFDLGPAWFWPGQPRMAQLAAHFDLEVFDQHSLGDGLFEDRHGTTQRARGLGSMQGSFRVRGGFQVLIERLAASLPPTRLHCNTPLVGLTYDGDGITATTQANLVIRANTVVLALPPRLAAAFAYAPALPAHTLSAMRGIPTWMAGHAKALLVFERAFWRDMGLSGDGVSQMGPMVEFHDASPAHGAPGALFGFLGTPPAQRRDKVALRRAVELQATRLFGPAATDGCRVIVHDWATDRFTSSEDDLQPPMSHPRYGMPPALHTLWNGRLLFGNTEVASGFGGFLEGALEAAEDAYVSLAGAQMRSLRS